MDDNIREYISLQSRLFPVSGSEIDTLEHLCIENNIYFQNVLLPTSAVQASALWSWVTIAFSAELIKKLAEKIAIDGSYDLLKRSVIKIIELVRSQRKPSYSDKNQSLIELQSPSAHLRIESENIPAETYDKAFDAFIKASEARYCETKPVIPVYIVIDGDNNVVEMGQNDYIWKYVAPQKPTKEDNSDGQT